MCNVGPVLLCKYWRAGKTGSILKAVKYQGNEGVLRINTEWSLPSVATWAQDAVNLDCMKYWKGSLVIFVFVKNTSNYKANTKMILPKPVFLLERSREKEG